MNSERHPSAREHVSPAPATNKKVGRECRRDGRREDRESLPKSLPSPSPCPLHLFLSRPAGRQGRHGGAGEVVAPMGLSACQVSFVRVRYREKVMFGFGPAVSTFEGTCFHHYHSLNLEWHGEEKKNVLPTTMFPSFGKVGGRVE